MFCQARVTCLLQILSVNMTQFSKGTSPVDAAEVISEEDKVLLKQLLLDIIDDDDGQEKETAQGPGLGPGNSIASAALQVFTVSFKLLYATSAERMQLLSRFVALHAEDRLSPQAAAILERVLHQLAEPSTLMDMQGVIQGQGQGQGHSAVADERKSEQPHTRFSSNLMSLLLTVYRKELSRKLGVNNHSNNVTAVNVSSSSSSSSPFSSSFSSSLYDATVMVMVSMVKIRCLSEHLLNRLLFIPFVKPMITSPLLMVPVLF